MPDAILSAVGYCCLSGVYTRADGRKQGERAREVSDGPAVLRLAAGEKGGARSGPQLRDAHVLDGPNLGPVTRNAGEGGRVSRDHRSLG